MKEVPSAFRDRPEVDARVRILLAELFGSKGVGLHGQLVEAHHAVPRQLGLVHWECSCFRMTGAFQDFGHDGPKYMECPADPKPSQILHARES